MEHGGAHFDAHLVAEARRADAALRPLAPLRQQLLQEMMRSLPTKQVRMLSSTSGSARLWTALRRIGAQLLRGGSTSGL
jgi:hypothetical protein